MTSAWPLPGRRLPAKGVGGIPTPKGTRWPENRRPQNALQFADRTRVSPSFGYWFRLAAVRIENGARNFAGGLLFFDRFERGHNSAADKLRYRNA
jgi:hypothetical protein